MYISSFLFLCLTIYLAYLYSKKKESDDKLNELQKMIALLQEQIQIMNVVDRRIYKLQQTGIKIVPMNLEKKNDEAVREEFRSILSKAYFLGWYKLPEKIREEIHSIREQSEHIS